MNELQSSIQDLKKKLDRSQSKPEEFDHTLKKTFDTTIEEEEGKELKTRKKRNQKDQ